MPGAGIEPARPLGPRDFKSRASASSATPAQCSLYAPPSREVGDKPRYGGQAVPGLESPPSHDVSRRPPPLWAPLCRRLRTAAGLVDPGVRRHHDSEPGTVSQRTNGPYPTESSGTGRMGAR